MTINTMKTENNQIIENLHLPCESCINYNPKKEIDNKFSCKIKKSDRLHEVKFCKKLKSEIKIIGFQGFQIAKVQIGVYDGNPVYNDLKFLKYGISTCKLYKKKASGSSIRTDCYRSVLDKFRKKYPNAIFEIITRTNNHLLSPSRNLLNELKNNEIIFPEYALKFIEEMKNPKSIEKIQALKKISENRIVFLVCFEKDPEKCHRSIIKKLIENEKNS